MSAPRAGSFLDQRGRIRVGSHIVCLNPHGGAEITCAEIQIVVVRNLNIVVDPIKGQRLADCPIHVRGTACYIPLRPMIPVPTYIINLPLRHILAIKRPVADQPIIEAARTAREFEGARYLSAT